MKKFTQVNKLHFLQKMLKISLMCSALLTMSFLSKAQVSWLHIEGNQIKDTQGNDVTLRGVSVLAPEHNNECEYCEAKPISEMISWQADAARGWNSRVLRLQVTTAKIRDPEISFKTVIDPYVQQAVAMGLYVIVDLHHVADFSYNGSAGISQQSVLDFWNYVAPKYANTPNVIFEVFNEPIGPDCWSCWKEYIQPVVDAIRNVAPNNLILMGGPQWSTRVNQAANDPFSDANMAYVYHIYPNQGAASTANLNAKFGTAAESIPVIITEFGWNQAADYSNGVTHGTTSGWGAPFREYLDARPNISWTSYVFDNFWKPQYFDWNWNLMGGENQGQFMQQWFQEMKDDHQPEPDKLLAHGVTSKQINLSWPGADNAISYNVKRASFSGGPYTTIATNVQGTSFSDTTLTQSSQYYYVISATTSAGEGPNSTEVSASTLIPEFVPDTPLFLTANGENGKVTLSWARTVGADAYNLKRSESSGGPYAIIATVSDTTAYVDTEVVNGQPYYYVVSAVNSDREGVDSGETGDVPSLEIITIDNTNATQSGAWTASSGSPGFYGTDYLHDGNSGTTGGKQVSYAPGISAEGNYHVSLWWTAASNRASNVLVEVHHAGGIATFRINQQYNGKIWFPLGIFRFNESSEGQVIIKNDDADGYVIADAVKFARLTGSSNLPPTAAFQFEAQGREVGFDGSGSWDPDGSIAEYVWNFGDSTTATGAVVSHVFPASGAYEVTLTVRDDSSASSMIQKTVNVIQPVNQPPTATFTYTTNRLEAQFDASSSSDRDGNITSYTWDFGDSTTAEGAVVTHSYAAAGDYMVTLTVSDDSSATAIHQQMITLSNDATETTTVSVNQQQNGSMMNAIGTFSFAEGTSGAVRIRTDNTNGYVVADAVRFSMEGQNDIVVDNEDSNAVAEGNWMSNNYSGGFIGSDYLHDDNSGKGTKNITYTPNLPAPGNWTVYMQWTSHTNRATNVPVDIIHLMDTTDNIPPAAAFTYTSDGLEVNFDASESTDDNAVTAYTWHFGDGATASGTLASHTYVTEGQYTVTLTVTDDNNATHSTQQAISVLDGDGTSTFLLNQQQNGGVMNVLGTFPFEIGRTGYVKIRTDNTDGYVVADVVKFSMDGQDDIILDNTDSTAITMNGTWPVSAVNSGFFGANYAHDDNGQKGAKSITFRPDLPVPGNWTVSIQWSAYSNRATNVPVDVIYAARDTSLQEQMFISEITKSSVDSGRWGINSHGAVTITVRDIKGKPVSNAVVSGTFSGDFNETVTGITGPDGTATLITTSSISFNPDREKDKPRGFKDLVRYLKDLFRDLQQHEPEFNFCVEDVAHDGHVYASEENSITCTESFVIEQAPVAEDSDNQEDLFFLYPNPLTGADLKIRYETASNEEIFVRIVSFSGIEVLLLRLQEPEISVDRNKFSPGIYLIHITSGNKTRTARLVVN